MDISNRVRRLGAVATVTVLSVLAVGASPGVAQDGSPAASGAPASCAPPPGTKHVSIVDKDMTDEEIAAAIAAEGGLTVGNWTYTANDELVNQFQTYVKDTYGVDITLTYVGSQAPSVYMTALAAAMQSGTEAPYDVMAVEENYWADGVDQGLTQDFLPSGIVPNQDLLLPGFQHVPNALAFQAASFIALMYNKDTQPWITSFTDLADPRLKGKVTLPAPAGHRRGRVPAGPRRRAGQGLQGSRPDEGGRRLGQDQHHRLRQHDQAHQHPVGAAVGLLEIGSADAVVFWNASTRLEYLGGQTNIAQVVPKALYPINGYLWIPKGAPHPVLAQTFINWRLCPEVQFPNSWNIEPWAVGRAAARACSARPTRATSPTGSRPTTTTTT